MKNSNEKKVESKETLTHPILDREKELKDLVNLCTQEIGLHLGILQGELLYLQRSQNQFSEPKTLAEMRFIAERILLLTRNLKVFSHINMLDSDLSDLSQVLLDRIDGVEKEFQEKGVRLTVMAEAGSYCKVDLGAINTALTSILLFAGHFASQDSELTVSLKNTLKEIRIEIKGTTPSRPHFEDNVFHPHALRDEYPSLCSLSLAPCVAKIATQHHGGSFEVTADKQGTTYAFTFPFDSKLSPTLSYPKQRRAKRINTHMIGEMSGNLQSSGSAVITVLSTLGAFLKLPKNKVGEVPTLNQEISFSLILTDSSHLSVSRAKIANVHHGEEYYGFGLEFIEVEPRAKDLLEEVVRCSST